MTCTSGHLFLSSAEDAKVHVYDLDRQPPFPMRTFDVAGPAVYLYSTNTLLARVAAVWGGAAPGFAGKVQFFSSGISLDSHGDHFDVLKEAPRKYSFELTGFRPIHFTSSAGFIGIFFDGVWSANASSPANQPSSAAFLLESGLDARAPAAIIDIEGGGHHGVAYALGADAFLVSQPVPARANFTAGASATPNGFKIHNAAGATLHTLDDLAAPTCASLHGAAHIGSVFVFGCRQGGLFRVSYDASKPSAERLSHSVVGYPVPVPGKAYRSSTIEANEHTGLFVANFVDAGTPSAQTPSYLLSLAVGATSASLANLHQTNTTPALRPCAFAVDLAHRALPGGGSLAAILGTDGTVAVTAVGSNGLPSGTVRRVAFNSSTIACNRHTLVAGYGSVYVLSAESRTVFAVNLRAAYEQTAGALSSFTVPFSPSQGVVSLPSGSDCESAPGTPTAGTPGGTSSTTSSGLSAPLWALLLARLLL